MTLYYEHQGWGTYTTDQGRDHTTYAELGWEIVGRPLRGADSQAALLTRQLRRSDDPLYARLRELLQGRGIDIQTAVLAQSFADDVDQEFGVLLAGDLGVFTFVLHYGRLGDLTTQTRTATIATWSDISRGWESSPYRRYVQEAQMLPDDWDD